MKDLVLIRALVKQLCVRWPSYTASPTAPQSWWPPIATNASTAPPSTRKIQSGTPRVVCGVDRQAGGTWLGVNQYGLFCAVANRPKQIVPAEPRSRGLLCRDLLELRTAKEAAARAAKELATGAYAGANYVCADARYAAVVHGGNRIEVVELRPACMW